MDTDLRALDYSFGKNVEDDNVFVLGCGGAEELLLCNLLEVKQKVFG